MNDREGDHGHRRDEILDRSKRLREEVAALRERNAEILDESRQAQEERQRRRDDADGVVEQREIERELNGLHDPKE